jgi:hypothetical protein
MPHVSDRGLLLGRESDGVSAVRERGERELERVGVQMRARIRRPGWWAVHDLLGRQLLHGRGSGGLLPGTARPLQPDRELDGVQLQLRSGVVRAGRRGGDLRGVPGRVVLCGRERDRGVSGELGVCSGKREEGSVQVRGRILRGGGIGGGLHGVPAGVLVRVRGAKGVSGAHVVGGGVAGAGELHVRWGTCGDGLGVLLLPSRILVCWR